MTFTFVKEVSAVGLPPPKNVMTFARFSSSGVAKIRCNSWVEVEECALAHKAWYVLNAQMHKLSWHSKANLNTQKVIVAEFELGETSAFSDSSQGWKKYAYFFGLPKLHHAKDIILRKMCK